MNWDARSLEVGRELYGVCFNPEDATRDQINAINSVLDHEDMEAEIRADADEELRDHFARDQYDDPYDNDEGEQS